MPAVSEHRLRSLLEPFCCVGGVTHTLPDPAIGQLAQFLDLLVRWNARMNLTAIRDPESMVERHLGESLFAGFLLAPRLQAGGRLLDLGSGAGLPGIPIQILLPGVQVTLAESQGKKAAFLREAVRSIGLGSAAVWAGRVEAMPAAEHFDAVTLRAVDRMGAMREVGLDRVRRGGVLLEMTGERGGEGVAVPIPGRQGSYVRLTEQCG